VKKGGKVLTIAGPTASLLTAERTALNFIQRLSGVATLSRKFADAIAGTGVRVVDTRKTTPGLARPRKIRRALRWLREPSFFPRRTRADQR